MRNKCWRFVNKRTGAEMVCNDLIFMIHRLTSRNLDLPNDIFASLLFYGKYEGIVHSKNGEFYDITIEEVYK